MDKKILAQLEQLNLSGNEAKVYLALLGIGLSPAGEIIKKTQLHRSVVYETLDKLIDHGLAVKIQKQKIAHFQANDPQSIVDRIKFQESIATDLIPQLKQLATSNWPEINIYEGEEAYQRFWIESISNMPEGSTDYIAGGVGSRWADHMRNKFAKRYFDIGQKKGITWRVVAFSQDEADYRSSFLEKYPNLKWDIRIIDSANASAEGNFNIVHNQALILHSAVDPLIIEVKNPSLIKIFRNLFDVLWANGRPIKRK